MIYAVIDTNVLVSALITHNPEAATAKVVRLLFDHCFVPMYDADIIAEYKEVLHREKFPILPDVADALISYIIEHGIEASRAVFAESMPDEDTNRSKWSFGHLSKSKMDYFPLRFSCHLKFLLKNGNVQAILYL